MLNWDRKLLYKLTPVEYTPFLYLVRTELGKGHIYVMFKLCTSKVLQDFSKFSTTNAHNQCENCLNNFQQDFFFYTFHYCNDLEGVPIVMIGATVLMAKVLCRNNIFSVFVPIQVRISL